jgi:aldose 1-epimerase
MKKILARLALISFALITAACGNKGSSSETSSSVEPSISSNTSTPSSNSLAPSSSDPKIVDNQLSASNGLKVYFKEQGARIDKIEFDGKQIAKDGFTVGRVANRIAGGKFTLNGTQYSVTKNDGNNSLHGGGRSWQGPFATANWKKEEQTINSIKYSIVSQDKDNGYPGEMKMFVTYTLSETGELSIEYSATTTQDTLCNPTNHLFIDINGSRSYSNVKLQVAGSNYTPLQNQIPTGEVKSVSGTKFDYVDEKAFKSSESYDDNYVLDKAKDTYGKAATLTGTQYKVDVYTDRPGLQLYKDGNGNICLETQMIPDAINHPEFDKYGTTVLKAGETFTSKTTYHFSKLGA